MRENEKGRSMIEMLGVLAVIGVLSVGAYDLVHKANNSRKTNAVIDEIGTLAVKSRTLIRDYQVSAGSGDGVVDVTQYVKNGRGYPDTLEYKDNAFYGTEDVVYKLYYPQNNSKVLFVLEVSGLTSEMCTQIATASWGSRSTNGFLGIKIDEGSQCYDKPLDIGTVVSDCEGDNRTITFSFR